MEQDSELRDSVYFEHLAKAARIKASETRDKDVSLRLRETAIRHERTARRMRREAGL